MPLRLNSGVRREENHLFGRVWIEMCIADYNSMQCSNSAEKGHSPSRQRGGHPIYELVTNEMFRKTSSKERLITKVSQLAECNCGFVVKWFRYPPG